METPKFIEYVSLVFIQDDTMKFNTTTQGHSKEKPLSVPNADKYYLGLEIRQELPMTNGEGEDTFIHENTRLCCEVEPRAEAFFKQVAGNCDIILRTGNPGDWRQMKAVPTSLGSTLVILLDREVHIPKGEYEILMIVPCEVNFYYTDDDGIDRIVEIQRKDWNFRFWVRGD